MMSLRCRSCNIEFHDNASLEVHYQYAHSNPAGEPLSSDTSRTSATDPDADTVVSAATNAAVVESNNNNFFKFQHLQPPLPLSDRGSSIVATNAPPTDTTIMTAISPGNVATDSRDFHSSSSSSSLAVAQHHLQQQHQHLQHSILQQQQQQQQHHHLHHHSLSSGPHHLQQRDLMYDIPTSAASAVAAAAANISPHHSHPAAHQQGGYDNFMMSAGQEYSRSSSSSSSSAATQNAPNYGSPALFNDHRYHPYYKSHNFNELSRGGMATITSGAIPPGHLPPHSPYRCEKCDFQSTILEHLAHHYHVSHNALAAFHARFGTGLLNGGGASAGAEPQAEILDLDSHKVHVYQPPNGEDSPDSDHRSLDPWHHQQHASLQASQQQHQQQSQQQQQHHRQQNGGTPNGRGITPLPSPDFGSVSTTTDNIENLQSSTRSPYYEHGSTPTHISSTDNAGNNGPRSSSKSSKNANGGTWKSNEARRPKTYNCSACNKWFTSSGHLKRHYNTTLHKNAVKQSGAPDPATLPVSAHHHPQKDPTYSSSSRHSNKNSTPVSESQQSIPQSSDIVSGIKLEPGAFMSTSVGGNNNRNPSIQAPTSAQTPSQQQPPPPPPPPQQQPPPPQSQPSSNNSFLSNPPNLMAGPSDIPGGLLHHHSYTASVAPLHQSMVTVPPQLGDLIKSPSPITGTLPPVHPHSNHLNFPAFATTPQPPNMPQFFPHMPTKVYPNFQSPHVSTTHQATTNNLTGNLTDALNEIIGPDNKLPSFACLPKNLWNAANIEHILCQLDINMGNSNVGGHYSSKENEATTLLKSNPFDIYVKCEPSDEVNDEEMIDDELQPATPDESVSSSTQDISPSYCSTALIQGKNIALTTTIDNHQRANINDLKSISNNKNGILSSAMAAVATAFSCEKCNKNFNKACYLTQHNKSFHSGVKPFKCTRCGKRFPDATQFNIHWAKHNGDKPYKCDMCPKAFNHKTDLRRHACLHTDSRPFSCDICNKGFIRKDHMLKHRETHRNRKNIAGNIRTVGLQVRNNRIKQENKAIT